MRKKIQFFKSKSWMQVSNHETSSGAFIEIDLASGRIRRVYICASDDQAAEVGVIDKQQVRSAYGA
jgi:hypothetical protein